MTREIEDKLRAVITEFNASETVEPKLVIQKKSVRHFCERFSERVTTDGTFDEFLIKLPELMRLHRTGIMAKMKHVKEGDREEYNIIWKRFRICLGITKGRPAQGNESGENVMIHFNTIFHN